MKIKVCIVCSGNFPGGKTNIPIYQAFIHDQVVELEENNCDVKYFLIEGKGIKGYLKNISKLKSFLKINKFDLVHAHSGLSGLLASLVVKIPLIVTYHGSDINDFKSRNLSIYPIVKASKNIFVSDKLKAKAFFSNNNKSIIIPCGVNMEMFKVVSKEIALKKLKIESNKKRVLFSSNFHNSVKNYPLAKEAISKLNYKVDFLEIKERSREEVVWLLNISDVLILTSHTEGSPQIIKEALACNCPIVSLDVGDVKDRIDSVKNCYISSPEKLTEKIDLVLTKNERSNGRDYIKEFSNVFVVNKIIDIYKEVLKNV